MFLRYSQKCSVDWCFRKGLWLSQNQDYVCRIHQKEGEAYTSTHADTCREDACITIAQYGIMDASGKFHRRHCKAHKTADEVFLPARRCQGRGKTCLRTASFGVVKNQPRYCAECMVAEVPEEQRREMWSVCEVQCAHEGCTRFIMRGTEHCSIHLPHYVSSATPRYWERLLKKCFERQFPSFLYNQAFSVPNTAARISPDFLFTRQIDGVQRTVVVECDENQHRSRSTIYDPARERGRLAALRGALNDPALTLVRFNPHAFKNAEGSIVNPDLALRVEVLLHAVRDLLGTSSSKVGTLFLYYDADIAVAKGSELVFQHARAVPWPSFEEVCDEMAEEMRAEREAAKERAEEDAEKEAQEGRERERGRKSVEALCASLPEEVGAPLPPNCALCDRLRRVALVVGGRRRAMLCTLHGGMCALHLGEAARLEEAFLYSSTRACAEPECDTEARFCRVTGEDALRVWGEEGAHAAMDHITAHPEGVEERACQKHFAERAKDGQFWLRRLVQNKRCGNKWCDGSRREGGAFCGGESCLCSTRGGGATMCGVRPELLRMFVSLLPPPPPPPPPPPAPSTPPPCRKRRRAEIEAHPAFDKPSMWNVAQLVDFILDRPGTPDRLPSNKCMCIVGTCSSTATVKRFMDKGVRVCGPCSHLLHDALEAFRVPEGHRCIRCTRRWRCAFPFTAEAEACDMRTFMDTIADQLEVCKECAAAEEGAWLVWRPKYARCHRKGCDGHFDPTERSICPKCRVRQLSKFRPRSLKKAG